MEETELCPPIFSSSSRHSKRKTEQIGTLQAKAVGGIGDLAENSLKVFKNLSELASSAEKSSDAVESAFKKIENIVGIVKGSADLFKNVTEVTDALKQISKIGDAGGEAGGLAKIAAAGAKGAGEAGGEAGGAVKGLTVLLTDMGSKLGAAASIAAPYAGLATATAGIYELAVHVLGWMGAIDVSSQSCGKLSRLAEGCQAGGRFCERNWPAAANRRGLCRRAKVES